MLGAGGQGVSRSRIAWPVTGAQRQNHGIGLSTLNHYFPAYLFEGYRLAGGRASLYRGVGG